MKVALLKETCDVVINPKNPFADDIWVLITGVENADAFAADLAAAPNKGEWLLKCGEQIWVNEGVPVAVNGSIWTMGDVRRTREMRTK